MPNWSALVANILLTASRWTDDKSLSPPRYWNGLTYEFLDQYSGGILPTIQATAQAGDIVGFSLNIKVPGSSSNVNTAALLVNGVAVWSQNIGAVGTFTYTTNPLNKGDVVKFELYSSYGPIYQVDAVLTPLPNPPTSYNCTCDNQDFPTKTLGQLRTQLMTRLGFAAMMVPPPGMVPLLDSFLIEAQELLYRRYKVFQCERWFTWTMSQGVRFYDLAQNDDAVNGLLQPPVMGATSTATVGGTLAAGANGYVVTALNANGETTPSTEVIVNTTGTTSTATINWTAITGATGYNVYGRTVAGETFMVTLGAVTTWTDTGAVVPGANLPPTENSTPYCDKTLDPRMVTWAGISQGDMNWRPLQCGINPVRYTSLINAIPDSYEIRQCIEVWPAPPDNTWSLRIKGYFGLQQFENDNDSTSIDYRAVFLLALATAKAHYGQPDSNNIASQLVTFMGDLVAGSHQTRRYVPGAVDRSPAVPPKMV